MSADVVHNICLPFCGEKINKVSVCFYEINNFKILQEACSNFQIAASDSKSCSENRSEPGYDMH